MIWDQITQLSMSLVINVQTLEFKYNPMYCIYDTNPPALSIAYTSSCFCAQLISQNLLSNLVCLSLSLPISAVLKQQHDIGVSFHVHLYTNSSVKSLQTCIHKPLLFSKKLDNKYYIVG